jgi:histidyl-tRNA synthetase
MVFEVFDNHPENNRSMFGGGRYNGLAKLFGKQDVPAVGFAPGDEPTRLFLEKWNLIPDSLTENHTIYLPLLADDLTMATRELATSLRGSGVAVEQGLEVQSLRKALDYANKKNFSFVIIYGSDEASQGIIELKDMRTGEQTSHTQASFVEKLKSVMASHHV